MLCCFLCCVQLAIKAISVHCFSQNLLEIVAYQTRQKHLQALKEGKYTPLCSSEQSCRNEQQKLQERLRAVSAIVHRVQQEQPQHHPALQWLGERLESGLGLQEA